MKKRAASVEMRSSNSSIVTKSPRRLDIRFCSPPSTSDTIWMITISQVSGSTLYELLTREQWL